MRDLSDVLLKTAMLDALLEDTVLRRDCGGAPFTKTPVNQHTSSNAGIAGISRKLCFFFALLLLLAADERKEILRMTQLRWVCPC